MALAHPVPFAVEVLGPRAAAPEEPVSSSHPLSLAHVCQAFHQGRQAMDQTQLRCQLTLMFLEKGLCPQEGPAWLGTLTPQGAVYGAEAFPGTT